MSKTDQFWQYAKDAVRRLYPQPLSVGLFAPENATDVDADLAVRPIAHQASDLGVRPVGITDELRRHLLFHLFAEERENLKRLERGDAQNSTEVMRGSK